MSQTRSGTAGEISRLTASFEQPIEPVRVSLPYRLGLVMVAVAMVLLPLIYVGLVVLVGWGLLWHITRNVAIFDAMGNGSGSMRVAFFVYVAPIVIGSILLLFMIKPIFARRPKTAAPVSLDPREEPTLFTFVHRLCAAVGAPKPSRIDVDHQVNASASFRRGMASMLTNDLVLTIGLPLAAGMTLRQLTGVLAHEFGHFAQGTGMRLTFIIRSVSYWFARVVYERDVWDVRLAQWSEGTDWRLAIVLHISRFFVWLTRRVLWSLMMAGHAISCFMLRHMEFDADRYEARVAGSENFEATVYRLQELGAASQQAFGTLQSSFRSGQLADDLPALIRANVNHLPQNIGELIHEHVRGIRTGAFDTHPADCDRIESAKREASEGVFHLQDPSTVLFHDFEALSKQVTVAFYRQALEQDLPASNLVPTTTLIQGQQELDAAVQILQRYFKGAVPTNPPLFLPRDTTLTPVEDMRGAYRELQEARRRVEAEADGERRRIERYRQIDQDATRAAQALNLAKSGYSFDPKEFGLGSATEGEATAALGRIQGDLRATAGTGAEYRAAAQRRIVCALNLIHHPQARERIKDVDDVLDEARRLLAALDCLRPVFESFHEPERKFASFCLLIQLLQDNQGADNAVVRMRALAADLGEWLGRVRQGCAASYPFDSETKPLTIGEYAVGELPGAGDLGEVHRRSGEAFDRLDSLYQRVLAALIGIAARIEGAVGLPPLPALEEERPAEAQ